MTRQNWLLDRTSMAHSNRDHGGKLDRAVSLYGGTREDWVDLSTGINPVAYPLPDLRGDIWTALPDEAANTSLIAAARDLWNIPENADAIAAGGASALIAQIPTLRPDTGTVTITGPTYNEHGAAFSAHGWQVSDTTNATAQVIVHPNNPDGRIWSVQDLCGDLTIIDESFCDVTPNDTLMEQATRPGTLILKSFGKFWGLAGVRLGFAVGDPELIAGLRDRLGPWAVSGPALHVGAMALRDQDWADTTRIRLDADAANLDQLMIHAGAEIVGGTSLFRLYDVGDAAAWQVRLAQHHIWSRVFPYNSRWLRLGMPRPDHWQRVEAALA